ncbi:MAG: AAA family ATPase [Candidatus Omnitrophota bacterium]
MLAIANQKGGCGKTTTSIHLSACLALLGKKVLLIDLDPQGHSTCGLGIHAEKLPYSLYDLLTLRQQPNPEFSHVVVEVASHLSLLPSYVILSAVEEEFANLPGKEKRLKRLLRSACQTGFSCDYVLIDCPPNLGVLTLNALEAADEVIIPVEPSFFSLHGLAKMSETLRFFNLKRSRPIETHALLTIFDSNVKFGEEVYQEVRAHFKDRLFSTIIHHSIALKEAASAGMSIDQYDQESQGFKDYFSLAVEFLKRDWDRRLPKDQVGWLSVLRRRLGPRQVVGGVLFQMMTRGAKTVEIAGDFNQWIPEPLVPRDDGRCLWQKVVPIPAHGSRYKFIVDGEWKLDPYQMAQKENLHGFQDSYWEGGS